MPIKNTCKRSKSGKGKGGGPSRAISFPLYVESREGGEEWARRCGGAEGQSTSARLRLGPVEEDPTP